MSDATIPPAESIPLRLLAATERFGDAPAYWTLGEKSWQPTTWRDFVQEVRLAARALLALGFPAGGTVAILGYNRPEWLIMAHAAMLAGGRVAGIYFTSAASEVRYVLEHAGAQVLLVENAEQAKKVGAGETARNDCKLVAMRGATIAGATAWLDFLALGAAQADAHDREIEARLARLDGDSVGTLIYTSGTTGAPKAVMLTQRSLTWTADALVRTLGAQVADRVLSYLPLAHIAEQMVAVHAQVGGGYAIWFAKSIDQLAEHLKDVRPTIFFGVPRVWERMQKALQDRLAQASGARAKLARWAMNAARRVHDLERGEETPGPLDRAQRALAKRLVLDRVRAALGLDAARWCVTGAAPLAADTVRFYAGLDISLREVYGLSETCGPTTLGVSPATPYGSVGQALPGVVLRVADDGELLIRGPNVFAGYLDRPDATAEALAEGWFHSGDLGKIDPLGNVYIVGRKKDLLITSGGKNVSPANIEADLMNVGLIEHAIVCGDGRHFLSALLTLRADMAARFAAEQRIAVEHLPTHPKLLAALQREIDRINTQHSRAANIRKFTVLPLPLSIADGELTATLKVRRAQVIARHREAIEAMYRN